MHLNKMLACSQFYFQCLYVSLAGVPVRLEGALYTFYKTNLETLMAASTITWAPTLSARWIHYSVTEICSLMKPTASLTVLN